MAATDSPHAGDLPQRRLSRIYAILAEHIEAKSDLHFEDPFELLIAVVLSAQATDASVNQACERLFPVANTPQAILDLGEEGLKAYIRTIGLYNVKASNIIKLCRQVLELHDGHVPDTRKDLEALPGVGRKTANVVLNIAFGQPTIAVDTHVHRVAQRLHIADCSSVVHTEQVLLARTPKRYLHNAHHYLILHGRYCCTARRPACYRCPIAHLCPYEPKTTP